MANFVSAEDMRRIAQHIRSKMTSSDIDLVERLKKIEEKIPLAASASNQLADKSFVLQHASSGGGVDGALEVYDDDGNLVFGASPDGAKILMETVTRNPDEITAEIGLQNEYYLPTTFKCGEDVFIGLFHYDEIYEDYEAYSFTFYRLAEKSFEKWWTITGIQAISLYYIINGFKLTFADAPDGKFVSVGLSLTEENETLVIYTIDILASLISFDPFDTEKFMNVMNGDVKETLATRGCLFLNLKMDDDRHNLVTLWKGECSVLFDEPIPNDYYLLNAAVYDGFAYAAYFIAYYMVVFRTNLETGERQFCAFLGAALQDKLSENINPLMVDGDFITLFGTCRFFKTESEAAEPFVGAARIPQSSAKWMPWNGDLKTLDALNEQNVSPFRAYRMLVAEGMEIMFCPAFLQDGIPAAIIYKPTNGSTIHTYTVARLAFSDDEEHAEPLLGGVVAGSLDEESQFLELLYDDVDVVDENSMLYELYSFIGMHGMAFPARLDGLDTVRMSHALFEAVDDELEIKWGLTTKFIEHREDYASEIVPVGTGFTRVSRVPLTGSTRYYLASGEYIEFNEDGMLSAQTGPKGAAGRDGKDGAKGENGDPAGFGEITASVHALGMKSQPTVDVSATGDNREKNIAFSFGIPVAIGGGGNFRGSWANWASVPEMPIIYPPDTAGSTTPKTGDYMIVQDMSDYSGLLSAEVHTLDIDLAEIAHDDIEHLFASYTKGFSYSNSITKCRIWLSADMTGVAYCTDVNENMQEPVDYSQYYKFIPFNNTSDNPLEVVTGNIGTIIIVAENWPEGARVFIQPYAQENQYKGEWQLKYASTWNNQGKDGWMPEFALGDAVDLEMLDERYQTLFSASQQDMNIASNTKRIETLESGGGGGDIQEQLENLYTDSTYNLNDDWRMAIRSGTKHWVQNTFGNLWVWIRNKLQNLSQSDLTNPGAIIVRNNGGSGSTNIGSAFANNNKIYVNYGIGSNKTDKGIYSKDEKGERWLIRDDSNGTAYVGEPLNVSQGIILPTSQPSTLIDGMIWVG